MGEQPPLASAEIAPAGDAVAAMVAGEHHDDDAAPRIGALPGHALAPAGGTDWRIAALPPVAAAMHREGERLNALATAKYVAGDYVAAVDQLRRVLNLNPDSPPAHNNLAIALWRTRHEADAELHCRRAIALDERYLPGHKLMGELLRQRDESAAALACYERVLALAPNDVMAHNNSGLVLRDLGRLAEAEAAFARAAVLAPDDPGILFNRLMMRRDDAGMLEAIACCRLSLARDPNNSDSVTNLAVALLLTGNYDESLAEFERAIAMKPDNWGTRANMSLLLLLLGDYERGWREYEHRWDLAGVKRPKISAPLWQGEDLAGRTILLHHEQGFGDTIQCLRYVPLVAARGGRVVLRIERALVRLAAGLPDNVVISPQGGRLPDFDVWSPLLSLPRVLETRVDNIPATVPYLRVRSAVAERWKRRLAPLDGLKVGLVWGGSPRHANDFRRSIDVARLAPLFGIPGARLVSLQAGPRAADITAAPAGALVDLAAELTDFVETAGALMNLDLLIAVDTSVVHLAGALGRPVWAMLPFSPDWRWLLDREDSPWYPTARLYRQSKPGEWDAVIARVAADLAGLAAARATA
jgi:Flp pilus assembly protein TadD